MNSTVVPSVLTNRSLSLVKIAVSEVVAVALAVVAVALAIVALVAKPAGNRRC